MLVKHCIVSSMFNRNGDESFFGYYDEIPINQKGQYVLFYSSKHPTFGKPHVKRIIILVLRTRNKIMLLKIPICVYNWQQGNRSHWLTDDLFVFNDYDANNKKCIARVRSASLMREVKKFGMPIQVSYKTEYFLSLNYQRLMALCHDYGYRNLPEL